MKAVADVNVESIQGIFKNGVAIKGQAAADIVIVIIIDIGSLQIKPDVGFEIDAWARSSKKKGKNV